LPLKVHLNNKNIVFICNLVMLRFIINALLINNSPKKNEQYYGN